MSDQDMTWQEVQAALKAMEERVGGYPSITLDITGSGLRGYVQVRSQHKFVKGDTFRTVVESMSAATDELLAAFDAAVINKMAHRIIDITAANGNCTAAALRCEKDFSAADVERYGPAACEEANKLASNGPFSIVPTPSNQVAA